MLHKKDVASCTKMCYTNNVNKKWKKYDTNISKV